MAHPEVVIPISSTTVVRAPFRERISWALYDFANTIFSMNIATLYFNVWLISDLHAPNTAVAVGNGISSFLVAVSIPIFGAISDARRRRVPWVVWLTLIAVAATIGMGVIGQTIVPLTGDNVIGGVTMPAGWQIGGTALAAILAAFVLANYTYQGAIPFYNAMLPDLVPQSEQGRLSGLGSAMGYIGAILGVILIAPFFDGTVPMLGKVPSGMMRTLHSLVPFTSHEGRAATFVPTALLFLLFSLPLFFFCRDHTPAKDKRPIRLGEAFRSLWQTFRDTKHHPGALRFILTSFLYQDAMGTIVSFMAIYAIKAMKFESGTERKLFIVLTIPAVFGAYFAGKLVDKIGPKKTLMGVLTCWIALLIGLIFVPSQSAFWALGFGIGFIFGGVSTAERPLLLTLIPKEEAGRFFSLMVLSSRAAAILGPFVWAFAVDGLTPQFGEGFAYRAAVGTVSVGFVLALALLSTVPDRFKRGSLVQSPIGS
ncbi:MAG: MFS transporter [Gemmatimonadota bacterium]|nr:MFS transporter [Gemmatimonadota bacterium]